MSIAWKLLLAFGVVLLVVLGLGLWSLQASTRLHDLNRVLLYRAIPAVRVELALAQQVPLLVRHAAYPVLLRDPAYEALHRERAQEFRDRLQTVSDLLEGAETHTALDQVRARFAEYLQQVDAQWAASHSGQAREARRRIDGPTQQASDALLSAVGSLSAHTQAELERRTALAAGLEQRARTATLLGFVVTLAVGLGVALLATVVIGRPIRALSRATQQVARGEYDVPLVATSHDELGDLARAFRTMADQLRKVETLKQEFFYGISHDLRSPLTSIHMAASLLDSETLGPAQRRWLQIIQQDAEKLYRLVNQILDLAKLRAGSLRLDCTPTDVRLIVESAVQEIWPLTDTKGLRVTAAVPDPSPWLVCDETRIQQALSNLLSNAVKFTSAGGRIDVTAREQGAEVIVTVADTGVGISADELPRVFDRYYQTPRTRGGAGLGLSIVKGLVEAHGGRVWVESEAGVGSRFHLALPREMETA
jgi:histidine kinase